MEIRKFEHRRGCTGSCVYCNWIKRGLEEIKELRKLNKVRFAWDEASTVL